ncbi:elongator complex protein 1 [Ostrinia furnacalis]|uniref:elongator complex protein 1 n=1 Tax=Ostrinia furnacalis TaxID=93504 RepID=UPI00103DBD38|nr:elongator complex protein 1 [Ostrinia furnacalis]
MKNLILWDVSKKNHKINAEDVLTLSYSHNERSCAELYTCSLNLQVTNIADDGKVKWQKDLSDVILNKSKPVNVTYLSLLDTLCVGLEDGELVTIAESGSICELAGVCESGILAMEWSPDQELLVLATKSYDTILMSCTYDTIQEVNLLDEEFGQRKFMTVGWGKKETQFHGSEGKQAAKVKTEITPESGVDDSIKITWRGDGNMYAIGFNMDGLRRFKVFDREGHLLYTSEKQPGLEANLSWRPSGNVITTTQRLSDQYIVSFFEKNGLKHGSFSIPVKPTAYVEHITWSSDSEILTLLCGSIETNTQELLLFTSSNYHWFHKQTLQFKSEQRINKIIWDNDFDVSSHKTLHIFLQNGQHLVYKWIWNVDHSRGQSSDDDAVVAVIDGKKLLVTGFRQTVVPPPMSAAEIELDSPINCVQFAPSEQGVCSNNFFVITTNNKLIFYEQKQKFPLEYNQSQVLNIEVSDFPYQYYNWFWMNHDTILCTKAEYGSCYVLEYRFEPGKFVQDSRTLLPGGGLRIQPHPAKNTVVFIQLRNGEIVRYDKGGSIESQGMSFSVACPKFSLLFIDETLYYLGLSHKNTLNINGNVIMNGVSSYFVHTHFLLITTLQHLLLCTELTKLGLDAIIQYQTNESSEKIYKRKIERGTKLVVAVANDTRTVFQMPRGNLEAIQPRPLSLKVIGEYLDAKQYHEAFDLMRKQRINLNLIYDHDPIKFVESIDIFLGSIQNVSWLTLFLSDLENVDVTKTMYASSYPNKPRSTVSHIKVHTICDMVRSHLKQRADIDHKIVPLLTTYVKKNTVEDLESALSIIKKLKTRENSGSKLAIGSDDAIKYLLYMVDVNELFNIALGMYDFGLVLLIADKSQKDPKEYIPMLNELNEMDENYKQFSINKYLKRFSKAVKCLVMCGPEKYEELKTLVKYHSLYREALDQFPVGSDIYKEISNDFGHHLQLKKQHVEAGIVFERAGNYEKAVECYKDALEWELAIEVAYNRWTSDHFKELCWDLVNALKEEKRHNEALNILEKYYDDCEKTISYAIESGHYKTALRLCSQHSKSDLRETTLVPAVLEDYTNLKELIDANWSNFTKHRDRLQVVRENKNKGPSEIYDPSYAIRDCDLYSDAGSTLASSSRGSSRSFRSSKNRRKHERKLASLKEGSQYEDVALIMALHTVVTSTFELRLQVKQLNVALSCLDKDKEALILQMTLEKCLKEMKDSFRDIWTNDLVMEATKATIAAQTGPETGSKLEGIATLEPHIRIAPVIQDVKWKLEGLN